MAILNLTTLFTYPPGRPPAAVEASDIPLPKRMRVPANGLTCLYGFRDMLDEVSRQHKLAASAGMTLGKIKLTLDLREPDLRRIAVREILMFDFIRTDLIGADTRRAIIEHWERFSEEEGRPTEVPFRNARFLTARPHYIGLLRDQKGWRNLDLIIYRIDDPNAGPRQVATLFSLRNLVDVETPALSARVILPARFARQR
jgi:hypothetical protein